MISFEDRQISSNLALPVLFVGVLVSVVVIALTVWSASRADEQMLAREVRRVGAAVSEELAHVPYQQASVTVWDDAAANTTATLNQDWAHTHLGAWLHHYFGHDQVILLNKRDEPVYGMIGGEVRPSAAFRDDLDTLRGLIYEVRRKLIMRTVVEDNNVFKAGPRAAGLGVVKGHPAIISVQPILLNSGVSPVAPGRETLHATIRYLDGSFLQELGERLDLSKPRFSWNDETYSGELSYPLSADGSKPIGFIIWSPSRPAGQLLTETAPLAAVILVVLAAILTLFLFWLRKATAQLEANEAQTRHQALHDPLTGLPNRTHFDRSLRHTLSTTAPEAEIGVFYIDLDRFKDVNDTLGHPSGDLLIRQVGERLFAVAGSAISVARLGGDEFAILAPMHDQSRDAEQLCRLILAALQNPFEVHGRQIFVQASIGVAVETGNSADSAELVRRADIALYKAKADGGSRFRIFSLDMDRAVQERREIQEELRGAITDGQLSLVYQPFYSSRTSAVAGAEALVRWQHPVHGTIRPDQFIPIAEESALIVDLGEWVLREACRTAAVWGLECMAINVSPVQFQSQGFAARVLEIILGSGLKPQQIELEITETVLADGSEAAARCIQDLRQAGVRVSIDDFGTGYSSLRYLQRFPLDKIKIDRSFVQPLQESAQSRAIVVAMVELARALGVRVTAEGVETVEQKNSLVEMGCDYLQGYHLGRPLTVEQMQNLLARAGASSNAA